MQKWSNTKSLIILTLIICSCETSNIKISGNYIICHLYDTTLVQFDIPNYFIQDEYYFGKFNISDTSGIIIQQGEFQQGQKTGNWLYYNFYTKKHDHLEWRITNCGEISTAIPSTFEIENENYKDSLVFKDENHLNEISFRKYKIKPSNLEKFIRPKIDSLSISFSNSVHPTLFKLNSINETIFFEYQNDSSSIYNFYCKRDSLVLHCKVILSYSSLPDLDFRRSISLDLLRNTYWNREKIWPYLGHTKITKMQSLEDYSSNR